MSRAIDLEGEPSVEKVAGEGKQCHCDGVAGLFKYSSRLLMSTLTGMVSYEFNQDCGSRWKLLTDHNRDERGSTKCSTSIGDVGGEKETRLLFF